MPAACSSAGVPKSSCVDVRAAALASAWKCAVRSHHHLLAVHVGEGCAIVHADERVLLEHNLVESIPAGPPAKPGT